MSFLTDEELVELHSQGESDRVERKRNAANNGDNLDKIRQAICAFANDLPNRRLPGVIFIGVEDDGSCSNLDINDELLQRLAHLRDDGGITPFPAMVVRRLVIAGCPVAAVVVEPTENPPLRVNGRTWIRVGPRRAVASPEEERILIEKRRAANLTFDARPVQGATKDDLNLPRFNEEYLPSLVSRDTIAQNQRTVDQKLQALRLIDANGTPTTTAILMIGKSPQDWFPGAIIAWRRVRGTALTDETLDEKSLTGTLPDQLRRIDEIMDAAVALSVEMGRSTHTRAADYPLAALQQIVRNAVMHRAYDGNATPVRIVAYQDRFEILSPGGPYGAVTAASFGLPGITDYRNPTLAEALKGYGFVEKFGQGMEIVRDSLAVNGNPPVEFALQPPEAPNWVHVIVRKRA